MSLSLSRGVSKSGAFLNVRAPEDSSIEKLSLSSPPEIDHVTVSFAENVPTEVRFSFMEMLLDKSPDFPESPVMVGAISSISRMLTDTVWEDLLSKISVAEILSE